MLRLRCVALGVIVLLKFVKFVIYVKMESMAYGFY